MSRTSATPKTHPFPPRLKPEVPRARHDDREPAHQLDALTRAKDPFALDLTILRGSPTESLSSSSDLAWHRPSVHVARSSARFSGGFSIPAQSGLLPPTSTLSG
jgi:hypothetical protein